jgi:hypothetical protein
LISRVEGNVMRPLLMGRAVELNGVAVVLAVAVGSVLAGIAGGLLSVPLAVLNAGIRALVSGDVEPGGDTGDGASTVAASSAFPSAGVPADPYPSDDESLDKPGTPDGW